ncbi:hypothetical protein [Cryobacterium sp. MLB-32]|uniref:hypothetical protein n=1 Tax=Cryobacterium sp. MLB-32 TaxID=1529318 RepID=UPI000568F0CC|nr:hypothetical protein [Cryobacterium sp. MLB-32]
MTDSTAVPRPDLSAIVVLRPGLGRHLEPDPVVAHTVVQWFTRHGFSVSAQYGLSMAVEAPRSVFQGIFGSVGIVDGALTPSTRLSLETLPAEIARHIEAIGTPRKLDFGPTP